MSRAEIKARAKAQLGRNLFGGTWLIAIVVLLIQSVLSSIPLVSIIVAGPITFGVAALFLKQARDGKTMEIGELFRGFQEDFGGTFLLWLFTTIFTALWSLLFVIPGIVKSYAYSMGYYLKADHPEYTWQQCLSESQRIMKGHKMDLFIQDLSFIGWMIVGSFCCGIGTLWVMPYMMAARAQFYESLRYAPATV